MAHSNSLLLFALYYSSLLLTAAQSTGSTQTGDLPPYSSGSLRGTEDLLGADGNPTNPADTAVVDNPQYVPGQTESASQGLYLDFNLVEQPQPIRGSRGGTDPGHRRLQSQE